MMKRDGNRWIITVLTVCFTVLAGSSTTNAIQYIFGAPRYTYDEGGTPTLEVTVHRTTTDTTETLGAVASFALDVGDCPSDCPLLPGVSQATSADYTVTDPSFAVGVEQATVSITATADDVEEPREYFCLSVQNAAERGSQWYTQVVIPWNDNCVDLYTPGDGVPNDENSPGYDPENTAIARYGYVGPWSTGSPISIEVTPQLGTDINIFMTTSPDNAAFDYYGILLDDSFANNAAHGPAADPAAAPEDTVLNVDDLAGLIDEVNGIDFIDAGAANTFELSYTNGAIGLDPSAAGDPTISTTDANQHDIKYLYVSSAMDGYANWKVCGAGLDKRIPTTITASGSVHIWTPDKAIDGDRDALETGSPCFYSAPDANGAHWLQLDLNREFHIRKVVIFPVLSAPTDAPAGATLSAAVVRVGSCRLDDRASNPVCGTVPALTSEEAVDIDCSSTMFGRYVYITSTTPLPICEVYVYGDDVPIGDETKVEFAAAEATVAEDGGSVALTVTRTGTASTCTYATYFTDVSVNDVDFDDVPPTAPGDLMWTPTDSTKTISILITNDDTCEPTENFNVTISSVDGGLVGTQCRATVKITDDDSVTYSLAVTPMVSEHSGPISVSVVRSGDGVMQSGSATLQFEDITTNSDDYAIANAARSLTFPASPPTSANTQTAPITIVDDSCYEESETFNVVISSVGPTDCSFVGSATPVVLTVTDNDSKFSFDVDSDNLEFTEGDGSVEIYMTRTGTVLTKTVDFTADHITTSDDDFSISPSDGDVTGDVTFDAGSATTSPVIISVNDDNIVEGDELFTLTLEDPNGVNCPDKNRGNPYSLNIRIIDNDAEYYWKQSSFSVGESDRTVNVCLVCTGYAKGQRTVAISTEGVTAVSGSDFSPVSQLVFQDEDKEKCVDVNIIPDSTEENAEMFTMTIVSGQDNIVVGSPSVATVTIIDDDDNCVIGWQQSSYITPEGISISAVITASMCNDVSATVTSTSGAYTPLLQSITISGPSYSLALNIPDDLIPEGNEIFTLTLSSPSSGTISQQATTITVTDNDSEPTTTPQPSVPGLGSGAIAAIAIAGIIAGITTVAAVVLVGYWIIKYGATAGACCAVGAGGMAGARAPIGTRQMVPLGFPQNGVYNVPNNAYDFNDYSYYSGNNAFFP